jgi:hypothetical protein
MKVICRAESLRAPLAKKFQPACMNAAVSKRARAASDIARVYREWDQQATAIDSWRTLAVMRLVYLADAPYVHTRRVVEHFAGKGHEVHVISFRPAEIPSVTVHHVDGLERIGKARYLVHSRRVKSIVRDLQPDILHALHLTSYGFLAGLTGWQPSIVSVWGTDVLEAGPGENLTDAEMESFIDRLGNEKKRSIDEVRDFSFVRQAWKELEAGK